MPRKFKRVLRKRYSKSKAEKCGHDDDADHSEKEESVSLITTGSISEPSTQADLCHLICHLIMPFSNNAM